MSENPQMSKETKVCYVRVIPSAKTTFRMIVRALWSPLLRSCLASLTHFPGQLEFVHSEKSSYTYQGEQRDRQAAQIFFSLSCGEYLGGVGG